MFNALMVKKALLMLGDSMTEQRDELIRLDGIIGDGDLGITMSKGFTAAAKKIESIQEEDIGGLFVKVGMAIASAAPSTMGTLMGTGFMRGGKAVKGKKNLDANGIAAFFRGFTDGIMERGKAKTGEKTILDVLEPVAQSAAKAAREGSGLDVVAKCIKQAAKEGREATRDMVAQHGKAAIYREQNLGKDDPGAVAGQILVDTLASVIRESYRIEAMQSIFDESLHRTDKRKDFRKEI